MQLLNSSAAVEIVRKIVVLIAAVHNLCIWAFHGTYSFATNERNKIHTLSAWALTLIILASIGFVIVPYITPHKRHDADSWDVPLTAPLCKWILASSKLTFFVYPKTIGLYYVYVERLFHIFKGNVYAFKKWQKRSLRSLLVALTLMWTVVVIANAERGHTFIAESNTSPTSTFKTICTRRAQI